MRILRILKLAKIFRLFRVARFFRELRILILSIAVSLRSMIWAFFLLLIIVFLFSVYFCNAVGEHLRQDGTVTDTKSLQEIFGGIDRTMFTLFKAATGGIDWTVVTDALEDMHATPVFFFLLYFGIVVFAVMNVMTGIFVHQAMKAADEDAQLVALDESDRRRKQMDNLKQLFHSADKDHDGILTWPEMECHLWEPEAQLLLNTLGLGTSDVRTFFELVDGTGADGLHAEVRVNHFVNSLLRLKGPAKNIDVVAMRVELDMIASRMRDLHSRLGETHLKTSGSPEIG